uniref:Pleckstrin y domain-containing O member 1 n=1 Tax=Sphaerodactylus townsendi TaxID=933632 RepID=A0ACB8G8W5_9SAUR
MKKTGSAKRGPPEGAPPPAAPEKAGWVRRFCGRGLFRELWRQRYAVLRGEQLFVAEKEVRPAHRRSAHARGAS